MFGVPLGVTFQVLKLFSRYSFQHFIKILKKTSTFRILRQLDLVSALRFTMAGSSRSSCCPLCQCWYSVKRWNFSLCRASTSRRKRRRAKRQRSPPRFDRTVSFVSFEDEMFLTLTIIIIKNVRVVFYYYMQAITEIRTSAALGIEDIVCSRFERCVQCATTKQTICWTFTIV